MRGERYVLVGLARAQARWFLDVATWATSGALAAEFLKVLSIEELRARLQSGRAFSAVLVDATLPSCDRDLADLATSSGCAVIVIDDRFPLEHWRQLGASAALAPNFGRDDLIAALRAVAKPVSRTDTTPWTEPPAEARPSAWRGRLVAVTGAGGTGRSTLAMALAAGLAADPRERGRVVLADLALRAQQGLLHDAGDLVPGLSELVDAHRSSVLAPDEVRRLCFEVRDTGYDLLLGLRRRRDWAALRPATFGAALDGLRRCYRLVIADVDADVEGEDECGSLEVEERNLLARVCLRAADLVVVVGVGGVTGTHAHVQVMRELLDLGVPADRLVPVINRAPRNPRLRAELATALVELLDAVTAGHGQRHGPGQRQGQGQRHGGELASTPLFVPERRRLDDALRDDGRVPAALVTALAAPLHALVDRLSVTSAADDRWQPLALASAPVEPGSLARWSAPSEEHV